MARKIDLDNLIKLDVVNNIREIRYLYYDFIFYFIRRKKLDEISLVNHDAGLMLSRINEEIELICGAEDGFELFSDYLPLVCLDKLDRERFEGRDYEHIRDILLLSFNSRCLSYNEISQISTSNERMVDFVWGWLRELPMDDMELIFDNKTPVTPHLRFAMKGIKEHIDRLPKSYDLLGFKSQLDSSNSKHFEVVKFFDLCDFIRLSNGGRVGVDGKRGLMEYICFYWGRASMDNSMVLFVENNKDHLKWAWNYYLKVINDGVVPVWVSSGYSEDHRKLLITAYDLMSFNEAGKKLFISRLSKALSQEKYRDKMTDRKQVSFPLGLQTKDRLLCLAKRENKKIYEVIECLINQEYEKVMK